MVVVFVLNWVPVVVVHRHSLSKDQAFRTVPETGGIDSIVMSVEMADYTIRHTDFLY